MTAIDETNESPANTLCRSCGLCCTGHLFIWAKLRPSELDPPEALGLKVFRSDPRQRGFRHPCPLWQGECSIYTSPQYPHVCRAYQCKLLKDMLREHISLPDAQRTVEQAKGMIHELDARLPAPSNLNFRERLAAYLENPERRTATADQKNSDGDLRQKAEALVSLYAEVFGVSDVIDTPEEAGWDELPPT